jgi:hypothetical protein
VTVVAAVCLYIAIKIGSGIADIYQATNPGFYLLVYGAPLALTSAMLWLIGQALPSRVNDRATMAMNEANQGSNPVIREDIGRQWRAVSGG